MLDYKAQLQGSPSLPAAETGCHRLLAINPHEASLSVVTFALVMYPLGV
jgi:hypothetical protein